MLSHGQTEGIICHLSSTDDRNRVRSAVEAGKMRGDVARYEVRDQSKIKCSNLSSLVDQKMYYLNLNGLYPFAKSYL